MVAVVMCAVAGDNDGDNAAMMGHLGRAAPPPLAHVNALATLKVRMFQILWVPLKLFRNLCSE